MNQDSELYEAIVNTAVSLASHSSWESVRLSEIAAQLNISLADIYYCFAEKEQIGDAWFDRADQNMLKVMQSSVFEASDQHSTLPWRAVDETVLTGVYLITFCCWLTDNTSMYQRTRRCLERQLKLASGLGFLK